MATCYRDKFRDVLEQFNSELSQKDLNNIEKGVYNWTIYLADEKCIFKHWDNKSFSNMYIGKAMDIYANLNRKKEIDFNKTIDVFCVNQVKTNNFVNIPRLKAKQIVEQLSMI